MNAQPYTIYAAVSGEGFDSTELPLEEAELALQQVDDVVWVHIIAHDRVQTAKMLVERFNLRPREVDMALDPDQIAEVHDHVDALFVEIPVIQSINDEDEFSELSLFLGKRFLVSVSSIPLPVVRKRFEIWAKGEASFRESAAAALHGLIDAVVDSYFPISDAIQEQIETLEDRLFAGETLDVRDALRLKQRLLGFRRRVAPLRDASNAMLRRDSALIPSEMWPYFHDVYDHTLRLVEITDLDRDILSSILDAHLSIVSNRLNEVMRFLAVISTVLMSVTLVSSIYGMNFVHMPELKPVWGYPAALILMLVIALIEIWIFKRKKWL